MRTVSLQWQPDEVVMPSSLKAADETVQNVQCKVGKTMQQQGEKREEEDKAESENEAKKRNQREAASRVEWSGVIKNNDHFAISWQITIHQIVQITDISQ